MKAFQIVSLLFLAAAIGGCDSHKPVGAGGDLPIKFDLVIPGVPQGSMMM